MEGLSRSAMARRLGISRNTVAKYADMEDFSPRPETCPMQARSRVEPYARVVDSWLRADRGMPRKQRHTARRVFDCLVAGQGFAGSYSSVRRWVRHWRQEHRAESEGFMEPDALPGSVGSISVRPGRPSLAWNGTCMYWLSHSRSRICGPPWRCRESCLTRCAGRCGIRMTRGSSPWTECVIRWAPGNATWACTWDCAPSTWRSVPPMAGASSPCPGSTGPVR